MRPEDMYRKMENTYESKIATARALLAMYQSGLSNDFENIGGFIRKILFSIEMEEA